MLLLFQKEIDSKEIMELDEGELTDEEYKQVMNNLDISAEDLIKLYAISRLLLNRWRRFKKTKK